LCLCFVR